MNTLEKAESSVSIHHIGRFLKLGMPIYDFEVPDTTGRKTRKRRKRSRVQTIKKRYAFHANTKRLIKTNFLHAYSFPVNLCIIVAYNKNCRLRMRSHLNGIFS